MEEKMNFRELNNSLRNLLVNLVKNLPSVNNNVMIDQTTWNLMNNTFGEVGASDLIMRATDSRGETVIVSGTNGVQVYTYDYPTYVYKLKQ